MTMFLLVLVWFFPIKHAQTSKISNNRSKNVDTTNPTFTSEAKCECVVDDSCDTVWALSRRRRLEFSVQSTTVASTRTTLDGVLITSDLNGTKSLQTTEITNADDQAVEVSDSTRPLRSDVCDFARSGAPECNNTVINETNFEYFNYTINVSACASLLSSLRNHSCKGIFEPCNLEYLLDALLVLNISDAGIELISVLFGLAVLLGSLCKPETVPDRLIFFICFWKIVAPLQIVLMWMMVIDTVLCVITSLITYWSIDTANELKYMGCLNRLSDSYRTLNEIADETLQNQMFLGIFETILAVATFTQGLYKWITENRFVTRKGLYKQFECRRRRCCCCCHRCPTMQIEENNRSAVEWVDHIVPAFDHIVVQPKNADDDVTLFAKVFAAAAPLFKDAPNVEHRQAALFAKAISHDQTVTGIESTSVEFEKKMYNRFDKSGNNCCKCITTRTVKSWLEKEDDMLKRNDVKFARALRNVKPLLVNRPVAAVAALGKVLNRAKPLLDNFTTTPATLAKALIAAAEHVVYPEANPNHAEGHVAGDEANPNHAEGHVGEETKSDPEDALEVLTALSNAAVKFNTQRFVSYVTDVLTAATPLVFAESGKSLVNVNPNDRINATWAFVEALFDLFNNLPDDPTPLPSVVGADAMYLAQYEDILKNVLDLVKPLVNDRAMKILTTTEEINLAAGEPDEKMREKYFANFVKTLAKAKQETKSLIDKPLGKDTLTEAVAAVTEALVAVPAVKAFTDTLSPPIFVNPDEEKKRNFCQYCVNSNAYDEVTTLFIVVLDFFITVVELSLAFDSSSGAQKIFVTSRGNKGQHWCYFCSNEQSAPRKNFVAGLNMDFVWGFIGPTAFILLILFITLIFAGLIPKDTLSERIDKAIRDKKKHLALTVNQFDKNESTNAVKMLEAERESETLATLTINEAKMSKEEFMWLLRLSEQHFDVMIEVPKLVKVVMALPKERVISLLTLPKKKCMDLLKVLADESALTELDVVRHLPKEQAEFVLALPKEKAIFLLTLSWKRFTFVLRLPKEQAICLLTLPQKQIDFVVALPKEQATFLLGMPKAKFMDLLKVQVNDSALTKLDLNECGLGDVGAEVVAKCLKGNTTVQELDLRKCGLGDVGARALEKCLEGNTTLKELDLTHNHIEDAGAQALAEALKKLNHLKKLWLIGNRIRDAGAQALARALRQLQGLTVLDLRANKLSGACKAELKRGKFGFIDGSNNGLLL